MKNGIALSLLAVIIAGCAATGLPAKQAERGETATGIHLPSFPGTKKVIAVIGLRNEVGSPDPVFKELRVGFGLSKMLTTAMFETGRFRLVERNQEALDNIIKEQWLGQTGAVDSGTAAQAGRLVGAEAVVFGEVTEFGIRKTGVFLGFAGQRNITTRIAFDVKMVDTSTGELVGVASGVGSTTTTTAGVFMLWEQGVEQFDQTTVGQSSRKALYRIAERLARQYEDALKNKKKS